MKGYIKLLDPDSLSILISYKEITSTDDSGRIPLLCAVGSGNISIVKRMMKIGDIFNFSNIHGWNILHQAVSGGSIGMVEYILELKPPF